MQQTLTDDLRIEKTEPLISPAILASSLPLSEKAAGVVADARSGCEAILNGIVNYMW